MYNTIATKTPAARSTGTRAGITEDEGRVETEGADISARNGRAKDKGHAPP
jgi:hypothetical protein